MLRQNATAQEVDDRLTETFLLERWLLREPVRQMLPRIQALPTLPAEDSAAQAHRHRPANASALNQAKEYMGAVLAQHVAARTWEDVSPAARDIA